MKDENRIFNEVKDNLKRWCNIEKRLYSVPLEIKVTESINPGQFVVGVDILNSNDKKVND